MPRRAIFFDRPGILTAAGAAPDGAVPFSPLPGSAAAIRRLNQAGWQTVMLSNEPDIAAGRLDEDRLAELHESLRTSLLEQGARLDGIYHCPHDPGDACACRLPAAGMLERAREEMGIELEASFFVGTSLDRRPSADISAILLNGATDAGDAEIQTLRQAVERALAQRAD